MTVRELFEILAKQDPDTQIILSKDAEGNRFSPLDSWGTGLYVPESTWSGDLFSDLEELNENYMGEPVTHASVIVFWPVN